MNESNCYFWICTAFNLCIAYHLVTWWNNNQFVTIQYLWKIPSNKILKIYSVEWNNNESTTQSTSYQISSYSKQLRFFYFHLFIFGLNSFPIAHFKSSLTVFIELSSKSHDVLFPWCTSRKTTLHPSGKLSHNCDSTFISHNQITWQDCWFFQKTDSIAFYKLENGRW